MNKTPREIVLAAYNYLANIAPPSQKISEVRIEEVVPMTGVNSDTWRVVLSYDNIGDDPFARKREYKEFKVTDVDARVLSMTSVESRV